MHLQLTAMNHTSSWVTELALPVPAVVKQACPCWEPSPRSVNHHRAAQHQPSEQLLLKTSALYLGSTGLWEGKHHNANLSSLKNSN